MAMHYRIRKSAECIKPLLPNAHCSGYQTLLDSLV